MVNQDLSKTITVMGNEAIAYFPRVAVALIVMAIFWVAARIVSRLVQAAMSRTSTAGHVDFVVGRLSYIAVLLLGAVASLSLLVNITALITSLGLAGFAIGFAVKDILGNSLAGILILTQRPFIIGDEIGVDGIDGRVTNIRVRDTVLVTGDGKYVSIPNSKIFADVITNFSSGATRRITCSFTTDFSADSGRLRELILASVTLIDGLLTEPPPTLEFTGMGEKTAAYELKFWIDKSKASPAEAMSAAFTGIKKALEAEGVRIAPL